MDPLEKNPLIRTPRPLAALYGRMLLIRIFEEKVEELFSKGLVRGTAHTCIGQEAVAVGALSALGKRDFITSTHRGHGHFLARGGDPGRILAEICGRSGGYSGGRGGSQLMACHELGFLGANGITGGSLPLALGVALSMKLRKQRRVTLCFFGDGAASQGSFHESLNMAGLWRTPVIFLCENNLYAMSTAISRHMSRPEIASRAAAYGIAGEAVDGNDVLAVRDAVSRARKRALKGEPTLIEAKTYRISGHSRGDPRVYRTREEEEVWRKKDPIAAFRGRLYAEGLMSRDEERAVRAGCREELRACVRFAMKSPEPDPATLTEGLFA